MSRCQSPKAGNHLGLVTAYHGRDTTVLLIIYAVAETLQAGLSCTGLRLPISDLMDLPQQNLASLHVCLNNHPLCPRIYFSGIM